VTRAPLMQQRFRIVFTLAALLCALDQLTKYLVVQSIAYYTAKPVIPGFFNLVHVLNKGSAFGFLNHGDIGWQRFFFISASFVAAGIIVYMTKTTRLDSKYHFIALGLLLGGALGNLVDRMRLGEVIDFLDVYVGDYHWPAFNVADSAITIGALLLIAVYYRHDKQPRAKT
jgi:signal peptidase II